jgi:hypothetical protein
MPKVSHKSIEEQNLFANIHLINISIFQKALQIYYNIHVKSFFLDRRKMVINSNQYAIWIWITAKESSYLN